MKSITKFISRLVCLLIAMVFMVLFSACDNGNLNNSIDPIEPGNNETLNIYELYGSNYYSFANIGITSVSDNIYCDLDNMNTRYLILEGTVAEDYYCKLE